MRCRDRSFKTCLARFFQRSSENLIAKFAFFSFERREKKKKSLFRQFQTFDNPNYQLGRRDGSGYLRNENLKSLLLRHITPANYPCNNHILDLSFQFRPQFCIQHNTRRRPPKLYPNLTFMAVKNLLDFHMK